MAETKSDSFKRLAENRTNRIIGLIKILGNLANTSNYEYTEEQVDKIFSAISKELTKQRGVFKKGLEGKKKDFELGN